MASRELSIFDELRPTNRTAQTAGANVFQTQNVIGKNSTRSALPSKDVVEGDDRAVGQKRLKQFEILFCGRVTMIPIDPKNTNRFAPLLRQLL